MAALAWTILVVCMLHSSFGGRVYVVDQKKIVVGERIGTFQHPFKTIKDCVTVLKTPGDECHIRDGFYHEEISFKNLKGTEDKPFVIRGYKNERPVLDGTVKVNNVTEWKKKGNIYSAKISNIIWQLFFDGLMMTNARWPNAKWSDKSLFNGTRWPMMTSSSKSGYVNTLGNSLKDTNIDMNGALAILNVGSFETFVAKVYGHSAGKNDFSYKDTFGDYHFYYDKSRYFLEDKLELLDAPEEWYFNKTSKMLYMYSPDGKHPYHSKLRGKVQSYAFTITDSEHIIFKNLDFYGTAINAKLTRKNKITSNITFDSLRFNFHTYSKRMLGDISLINWMEINGLWTKAKPELGGTFNFYNNTFYGSDGLALSYLGRDVKIVNNLFEYNDWTGANMVKAGGGLATIKSVSFNDLFERNTLRYNGASVGIRPGLKPTVRLNDISKQCWGVIQNDGAGVQLTRKPQVNSTLEFNWVHDQPKYGLRFDGEPPRLGTYGTIRSNVVYRCNGLMVKGDYHKANNNIAFDKVNAKDDDKQGAGCALCILKYVRKNPVAINNHTIACNNIADVANGGKIIKGKGKVYPVAAEVQINNVFGINIANELMDPQNNDFRPQMNSNAARKHAGAYMYHANLKKYWIPGRQIYKASSPVPPTNSITVRAIKRDSLMWLPAHNCYEHNVYFTEVNPKDPIDIADPDFKYVGSTTGENNVVYLQKKLKRKKMFKWRVDAECEGSVKYTGDVWTFSTI